MVDFLQHPPFHADIWRVLELIENNFEKRVGLTELMYGEQATQDRSATATQIKASQLKIRPDDMVNKVEDCLTDASRKEALAARWHLEPQDLMPLMGQTGTYWWTQFVTPADPSEIIHQLEYRTEAGSARKPNKDKEAQDANTAMQTLFQPLFQLAMTGQVGPVNALIETWAKANEFDATRFMIQPPPMPVPQQAPQAQLDLLDQLAPQDRTVRQDLPAPQV